MALIAVEDELINILSTFKVPVIRQGSLAPDAPYPDLFFTFWCNGETEHSAYNDQTIIAEYNYDVNVYGISPTDVYDTLTQARNALKSAGWIILTRAFDQPSDEITHIGRGMNIAKIRNEEE